MLLLRFVVFVLLLSFSEVRAQDFSPAEERQRLLDVLIEDDGQKLTIIDHPEAQVAHRKISQFYKNHIWKLWQQLHPLSKEHNVLSLLLDRALYTSTEERRQWQQRLAELSEEIHNLSNSDEYDRALKEFFRLSKGLHGVLPNIARELFQMQDALGFKPEQGKILQELDRLSMTIDRLARESIYAETLSMVAEQKSEVLARFHSGEMNWREAEARLHGLEAEGGVAFGHDILLQGENELQKMALLRTQLAQTKGFSTWAQYALETQSYQYDSSLRTPEQRLKFLYQILDGTEKLYREAIQNRMAQLGMESSGLISWGQRELLIPAATSALDPYFPKENIFNIWMNTMRGAGFSSELLSSISIDSDPRPNKHNHAYMKLLRPQQPLYLNLNTYNLEIKPSEQDRSKTTPIVQIVQNIRQDGLSPLRTMFHEGGHALDFLHRAYSLWDYSGASYNETHSIFMESFLKDRDFLLDQGRTRHGEKIPVELVDRYLQDEAISQLFRLRYQVGLAIYDLELWNIDYTKDRAHFTTESRSLFTRVMARSARIRSGEISGLPLADTVFKTSHFYGGRVDYFGYIAAEVAAEVASKIALDRMETESSRRSLYRQKELAKILVQDFYKFGHTVPFPEGIERFIRQSYSVAPYVQSLKGRLSIPVSTTPALRCANLFGA